MAKSKLIEAQRSMVREAAKVTLGGTVQQGTAWSLTGTLAIDGVPVEDIGCTGVVTVSTHTQTVAMAMPWEDALLVILQRCGLQRDKMLQILGEGPTRIAAEADAIRNQNPGDIVGRMEEARSAGLEHTARDITRVTVTLDK